MKFLIGILAVVVFLLALIGWRYSAALDRETSLATALAGAQAALEQSESQNRGLADRFGALDRSVAELRADQRKNQSELKTRLANLSQIVKEPGDSDASILCLRTPVPVGLDRSLREPTGSH